jgi:chemosensory pili system protein ChpA (sensor histidine kinase/response regulator)
MEHLLRNAIDHGFEPASVRQAQGKSATGRVTIRLSKEGTEVVLQVADDGAGIDVAAVRRKALERGLIAESTVLSEQQLLLLILEPGFSTAKRLSQVSGRGVGLDVVDNVVKQLSGTLQVSSHVSRGTTFTIRLPVMLSITQGLVVNTSEEIYAFPLAHIHAVVQLRQEELERLYRVDAPKLIHAGGTYQLLPLAALVERPPGSLAAAPKFPLLLMRFGEIRVALQVDSLIGRREMVVKSLGPILISVKGLLGATILGDGRVALILNAATLVRKAITQAQQMSRDAATPAVVAAGKPITVMVVDDSITIRKVTARLLERHQMQVITAKDGVDALEQLQDQIPDIAILDIEMPRMDGYELARHMRRTAELRHIPIIMITSRIGEKHRQYAKEIGVDRYLGKPYQESELLGNIHDLLQPRR